MRCRRLFISTLNLLLALVTTTFAQTNVGRIIDASSHHLLFTGGFNSAAAAAEPRLWTRMRGANTVAGPNPALSGSESALAPIGASTVTKIDGKSTQVTRNRKIDWSIPLGAGNVAPNQYPAKYGFDPNDQPDCVKDYVVFGVNVPGVTGGQANLVGINQLYSGTNPTGLCGTVPHVNWAYNGSTAGGAVLTSPALSLDGTKVAYVESTSNSAIFHVLTWKAGQGTSATSSAAATRVGSCTASTSCLSSLTYSTSSTTSLTSAWVDYGTDKVFVASDNGMIYRLNCAFTCALNTNPTVEWSFRLPVAGTGGALPVPSGPSYDSDTGILFVGDQLGEVWAINASGSSPSLAGGPIMVGGGGCSVTNPPGRTGTPIPCTGNGRSYGIPDGILIDGSGQKVFAFSGNDGTAGSSAVVVQMNETLTAPVRVRVGAGSVANTTTNVDLHIGDGDNNFYFGDPTVGHLFVCGTGPLDTSPYSYWIGFSAYPLMNSTATRGPQRIPVVGAPCTPLTEFYNPNIDLGGIVGHHDLLMSGVIDPVNGFLITDDISSGTVSLLNFVNYPGGISAIIIDNTSTQAQASSMYFSTLAQVSVGTCSNARCAVKLTQLDSQ